MWNQHTLDQFLPLRTTLQLLLETIGPALAGKFLLNGLDGSN